MTWAVFYTLNRQLDLGDTTHKIQNISNMFYLSPDDIKSDMKSFFADHFPLLPVLGLILRLLLRIINWLKFKFESIYCLEFVCFY